MEKSDLDRLKRYASTMKSSVAFGGATFIMFDSKTGKLTAGRAGIDMVERKVVADMGDAMDGFRQFIDKKPVYALTKVLDATVEPIQRSELGDIDESKWTEDRDPWVPVTVLPLFDSETRETFVFVTAFGERGAAGNLIDAYVDHLTAHPEAADQLPRIGFYVRQYTRNDGKPGYALQFDIEGWVDRPKTILHIAPPPLTITVETNRTSNGKSVPADSKAPDDKVTKRGRKVSVPGKPDYDDSVPF
jgi:hypothetical protein